MWWNAGLLIVEEQSDEYLIHIGWSLDAYMDGQLFFSVTTVQGVEMTEDQIELPDEPVTSPKQITVYVTVCSYWLHLLTVIGYFQNQRIRSI